MCTGDGDVNFARGWKAIERRIVAMHNNRVDGVRLLELIKKLLHGLNGVVSTQVDHHLLNLHKKTNHVIIELLFCLSNIFKTWSDGPLTCGKRGVSLLTPHKLMRNCRAVLRLLLHRSLLTSAFQAFSISAPGTSSPYWHEHNTLDWYPSLHSLKAYSCHLWGCTFAVMNMRLFKTIDEAWSEPQPVPLSRWGGDVLDV